MVRWGLRDEISFTISYATFGSVSQLGENHLVTFKDVTSILREGMEGGGQRQIVTMSLNRICRFYFYGASLLNILAYTPAEGVAGTVHVRHAY